MTVACCADFRGRRPSSSSPPVLFTSGFGRAAECCDKGGGWSGDNRADGQDGGDAEGGADGGCGEGDLEAQEVDPE